MLEFARTRNLEVHFQWQCEEACGPHGRGEREGKRGEGRGERGEGGERQPKGAEPVHLKHALIALHGTRNEARDGVGQGKPHLPRQRIPAIKQANHTSTRTTCMMTNNTDPQLFALAAGTGRTSSVVFSYKILPMACRYTGLAQMRARTKRARAVGRGRLQHTQAHTGSRATVRQRTAAGEGRSHKNRCGPEAPPPPTPATHCSLCRWWLG